MTEKKGFDLAAVLGEVSKLDTNSAADGREQIEYIDIDLIDDDPNNFYTLSGLDDLVANIELLGLQQPLRVRSNPGAPNRVIIVSGHRRKAAIRQLVDSGRTDLREIACIRERAEGSAALQELRLIYANSDTRVLSSAEISKQALRVETLLYQLKEEGYDFPGRMRDHVAEACKVSKTKLARLKVIREHLDQVWRASYEEGKLSESTAYTLAQMPAEYQQCIFKAIDRKNTKIEWFYEYEAKRYGEKLAAIDKLICKRGARKGLPCSNINGKRNQAVYQSGCYSSGPCAKCCDKCENLAKCKDACPMLTEKVKRLRASAKEQRRQEQLAKEERERPVISEIRKYWQRFGEARRAAGKTIKECCNALSYYYSRDLDQKVVEAECLEARFTTTTSLPYGVCCYLGEVQKYVRIADLLGCSLDYLLCRTDDPGMPTVRPQEAAWGWGDPAESGLYWCITGLMSGGGKLYWYNANDKQWEAPSAECRLNVHVVCWMRCPPLPESVSWNREAMG